MADELDELRWKVATACRILGMQGLVRESTGHVSARIPGTDEMFVRCRGGDERGLLFTDVDNVRRVDFDELESVALVRDFLQAPERYLRQIWIDEE